MRLVTFLLFVAGLSLSLTLPALSHPDHLRYDCQGHQVDIFTVDATEGLVRLNSHYGSQLLRESFARDGIYYSGPVASFHLLMDGRPAIFIMDGRRYLCAQKSL